jgi:hypothetical protein
MLDDVVGLVMVQIISNLGGSASSFTSLTVIRPVFVSIGFAVGIFLLCAFFIKPIFKRILSAKRKVPHIMRTIQFAFLYQTLLLVGLVAGATYAGTSSLFAAYLAGVIVTWFDDMIKEATIDAATSPADLNSSNNETSNGETQDSITRRSSGQSQISNTSSGNALCGETPTGEKVYEKYYKQPAIRVLMPLFFVSISLNSGEQTIMRKIGLYWFCNSYHRNVQRKCSLAWHHLCASDDVCKINYWCLAPPFLISAPLQRGKCIEKTVFSSWFLLHAQKT